MLYMSMGVSPLFADFAASNRAVKPTTQDISRLFMELKTFYINIVQPKCLNRIKINQFAWSIE